MPHLSKYFKLVQLALVLPVTSCEAECSFSTLRRLTTWLRSTMSEQRLASLARMCIHRGKVLRMSIDKIVFVNNKPRALEYVIYERQIRIKCKSISISNVSITGYFNKSLFRLLERRLNTVGPSSAMTSD